MSTTTTTTTKTTTKTAQLLTDFVNSDLEVERQEYVFRTPVLAGLLEGILTDKRDMPMVCLQLNILQYIIPGTSLLFYIFTKENPPPQYVCHLLGLLYVVGNTILFEERFILMLHYYSHRPIYERKYTFLNSYVSWVLTPFFGIPPALYKLHHVIMHHIENNHAWDISSTETYQRDSLLHFLMYYIRFSVLIYAELPYYCIKSKRWEWLQTVVIGLGCWFSGICFLAKFISFGATFWVFMAPVLVTFLAMSFGNWSQHIFVDSTRPENNYALSYNCIDTFVNQRTFNDGYHVIHHYNARMHWSEMPAHFHEEKVLQKHVDEGALTFRGLHFVDVGLYVMTGRLNKLAEHYVHLGSKDTAPTLEAIEEKMRSWLKPMPAVNAKKQA